MSIRIAPAIRISHAATRLSALAPLAAGDLAELDRAEGSTRQFTPHRDVSSELTSASCLLLDGWACRSRIFADGRRQIYKLLIPGDLIPATDTSQRGMMTTSALTKVTLCRAPEAQPGSGLAAAYEASRRIDADHLHRQIARLGRMSAYERVVDLLLEMRERLTVAGVTDGGSFPMPITQEVLADTLGLTSVHINRTVQALRSQGMIEWRGGSVQFLDGARLHEFVDYIDHRHR
jgi:CRP-like cAMP-binding protein